MTSPPVKTPTPEVIAEAVTIMRNGGIVICPSDANYGVAVDPFNFAAISSCFDAKRRPGQKPLTLFIADPADWVRYGHVHNSVLMKNLTTCYWPGPLNLVINKREGAPELAMTTDSTIAIACHANPVVRSLARAFGGAIAMTSANLSGTSDGVLVDLDTAVRDIGPSVRLALRGGPIQTTTSTTILRVDEDMSLLREGDLSFERLRAEIASEL